MKSNTMKKILGAMISTAGFLHLLYQLTKQSPYDITMFDLFLKSSWHFLVSYIVIVIGIMIAIIERVK